MLEVIVCRLDQLTDPGSKEFHIGEGDWPIKGFVVRKGNDVFAYQNYCMHVGHPLNWQLDSFLTKDGSQIICSSHGAIYEIESGVCVSGPCPGKMLRPVPVENRNGEIVVKGPAEP
jgi:nitrite reductase/ring-hydroxylating ferredoxin subunit